MYYVYDNITNLYQFTLNELDDMYRNFTNITTVPLLPFIEYTKQIFDTNTKEWKYIEFIPLDKNKNVFEDVLTYSDVRKLEYPEMVEYIDGIVKNNELQVQEYIDKCIEVKNKWSKEMEPITLREYYRLKGIIIHKITQ